jgi:hypothetical protein
MIRKKSYYPITVKLLQDNKPLVIDVFKKVRPHKGGFIGVCELKGCFSWENVGETFDSLRIGEALWAVKNESAGSVQPLDVIKNDGTVLGFLPYNESVLPNMLIKRGIRVICYVEAKEFNGGMPAVAVSIYSEDY